MKVNVDLILRLRKDHAWSQEELALAAGLNLRTIQRIETEATASLQSMKALASAFKVNIRALEHEESTMLNELVGKSCVNRRLVRACAAR
ncbi:MAG TPA: helix-turn-helix transcriptional regulator [Gammaproteobacteria bacterium]|nr:helix-turn-helix transcriptional regulator [Gammaproteobacteria bacterium]